MRRIYCLLLLLVALSLSAQDTNQVLISESFNDISLAKLIRKLRNKYDLKIAYDDALITGITVNGNYSQRPLPEFLEAVLTDKGIDYQLLNGKIILIPKRVDLDVNTPSLFDITVFGLVQDANTGENLPNALVRVSGASVGTITNQDGYFALPKVPTDTSTIEVSYLGYSKAKVKLKPGETKQTLNILMQEAALELAEFVVEGINRTIKYGDDISQISINPRNLAALPSLGELDIFRSLQLLPGIGGTNETSSALSIRNSPSTQNLVLFDGFTIYRLDHFFGVFSAINADAVRDIQVYKGGFGAKYGGRISGVVDITGSTGNFNEPSYSFGFNLMSARAAANIPFDGGRGAFHLSGRRAYTDIIRSTLFEKLYRNYREQSNQVQNQDFSEENSEDFLRPDFHFVDINFKASYRLSQRDIASFTIYNGRDDLSTDFDAPLFDDNRQLIEIDQLNEQAEWGNTGLGFTWSRNWNANYFSSLQLARSIHFFNYSYQTQTINRDNDPIDQYSIFRINDIRDWQLNFKNELAIGNRHNLEFGVNLSQIDIDNRLIIDELDGDPSATSFSRGAQIGAIYLSDKIYWGKLTLNPGIRYGLYSETEESYFSQRLAMSYQITPDFLVKGATGRYYQLVTEQQFDDPFSNQQDAFLLSSIEPRPGEQNPFPSLPVMKADHWIAGFQYEKNGLTIDVEYYNKKSSGLTELNVSHLYDPVQDLRSPQTLTAEGSSDIEGIDFLIQKQIGPYQGWIAYTRSKATNRFEGINNGEDFAARQDQRNELKLVNILELSDWNLSTTWTYGSGRPFYLPQINFIRDNQNNVINYEIINTNRSISRLPAYHRLDLSISRKFDNDYIKGEVGLSILNVYNRSNIHSRRLRRDDFENLISGTPGAVMPEHLYRDILLLDFTPSIFFNLNF